jgi:diguanylate cyclase (GGDEF)-like protein
MTIEQTLPVGVPTASVPGPVYESTRRLVGVASAEQASEIARCLVCELGGRIETAFNASPDVLPMDVSLGQADGFFPSAPAGSAARTLIEAYLPRFLDDARRALENTRLMERLAHDAGIDSLTGLPDRVAMGRLMARLQPGDLLVAMDLDAFEAVNTAKGRIGADDELRSFAQALRQSTRANESCSRMGGDEFLVVLYQSKVQTARSFLDRLNRRWERCPGRTSFSAGFAAVQTDGWRSALLAAERALQRAKESGPGAWEPAQANDYQPIY